MDNTDNCNKTESCKFGCLGYAYIPVQQFDERNTYSAEDALKNASLFPELVITMSEYGKKCTALGGVNNG